MNGAPRTELGDITPAGTELDESALSGISGGQKVEITTGWYADPPGYCGTD
ncbi:hypothetical protein [Streptosporangium pseudovulgare]|uniref:Uncharacterized protein n=1 Tax=Streptosporangium pseudovulgare TaxID=35765 RepID=A0ABQ2R579_9ACTN|nr:hypothetical protein [Streptosporangium pseudovulgare]GGQ14423.1 hypothetical protein GCM10010140_50910 [Streptosporangium pseudovulgare]